MTDSLTMTRLTNKAGEETNVVEITASEEGASLPSFWPIWARKLILANSWSQPTCTMFVGRIRVHARDTDRLVAELPDILAPIRTVEIFFVRAKLAELNNIRRYWRVSPQYGGSRDGLEQQLVPIERELGGCVSLKLRNRQDGWYVSMEVSGNVTESTLERFMTVVEWRLHEPFLASVRA